MVGLNTPTRGTLEVEDGEASVLVSPEARLRGK